MGIYLNLMINNYANFNGRARRKEYWTFVLFQYIVLLLAMLLDSIINGFGNDTPYGYIYLLASLIHLIPYLAVGYRRLHDVGRSGFFLLIVLLPIVGPIWFFILSLTNSDLKENKYGPCPK